MHKEDTTKQKTETNIQNMLNYFLVSITAFVWYISLISNEYTILLVTKCWIRKIAGFSNIKNKKKTTKHMQLWLKHFVGWLTKFNLHRSLILKDDIILLVAKH